jgi:hypothetical protein
MRPTPINRNKLIAAVTKNQRSMMSMAHPSPNTAGGILPDLWTVLYIKG